MALVSVCCLGCIGESQSRGERVKVRVSVKERERVEYQRIDSLPQAATDGDKIRSRHVTPLSKSQQGVDITLCAYPVEQQIQKPDFTSRKPAVHLAGRPGSKQALTGGT